MGSSCSSSNPAMEEHLNEQNKEEIKENGWLFLGAKTPLQITRDIK